MRRSLSRRIGRNREGLIGKVFVGDRLFVLANESPDNEFALPLAVRDGKQVWSTRLGAVGNPKQAPDFPAARSTPTVQGDWVYALSSDGDLACLDKESGKKRWQKSLRTEFGGKPGLWAYSESPLSDGETLVCAPGGSQATLVGLNKATGHLLWKCALPEGDDAAYASAIVIEAGGRLPLLCRWQALSSWRERAGGAGPTLGRIIHREGPFQSARPAQAPKRHGEGLDLPRRRQWPAFHSRPRLLVGL